MGFEVRHDRMPALAPTEFGLRVARGHARRLGPLQVPPPPRPTQHRGVAGSAAPAIDLPPTDAPVAGTE
jgi:hypothetical protein